MHHSVVISAAVIADIRAHAREEAPRECCGLLIGRNQTVDRAMRARNMDKVPTYRYVIDPADHFAAIRAARAAEKEVIGAYHSHPASAPVPSETDLAEANNGSDFVYVIVSVVTDEVRAYRCEDGRFVLQPVIVSPLS